MSRLKEILRNYMPETDERFIEEIRIKRGCKIILVERGAIKQTSVRVTETGFDEILSRACSYSYYSHEKSIAKGYISAGDGIRIGVAGQAICSDGRIETVKNINYLTIRIPHLIRGICGDLFQLIKNSGYTSSLLIFSPPGRGKTTLLRDLALNLSSEYAKRRVVILDRREEIYVREMMDSPYICTFSGYPQGESMEIAVRTMSPDYIIIDEIGSPGEADELFSYKNAGVGIIATVHCDDVLKLTKKRGIDRLFEGGCFDFYCGFTRDDKNFMNFKVYDERGQKIC